MAETQNKILGSRLVPDLKIEKRKVVAERYWFGLMPDCPVDPIQMGRLTFAKIMEIVDIGPGGETIRNPMLGCCTLVTRDEVEKVINLLPRMILRFQDRIIGGNDGIAEDTEQPDREVVRVGHLIRIPTDDEIEYHKKNNRYRPYVPVEEDRPVADFCYMVKQDSRGTDYPPPLSESGIELPTAIAKD